ncbi:TetR/AcrR family transcriptional regulator [Sciscionella sediminilitoris]|uniref:TetR/AcrR family transcriptional regulator n=1 Tax=Sciscionella sediminilitoris TaxID=1445613 RepID=UPI0004DED888|nr:TetR/AcrR family transcriptional regulator [Sciscionella sp. SE31]
MNKGKQRKDSGSSVRRAQLLGLAAKLFAERGFRSTTVRDIADEAGILSGSLYHHFDSKESMVDEILTDFLDELFGSYAEIMRTQTDPREALEAFVLVSFEAIERRPSDVAIYQNESAHLAQFERFSYLAKRNAEFRGYWTDMLNKGAADGVFRDDLDIELTYRFIRDTVWLAVRWYRPDGALTAGAIAKEYLAILIDGIGVGDRKKLKEA